MQEGFNTGASSYSSDQTMQSNHARSAAGPPHSSAWKLGVYSVSFSLVFTSLYLFICFWGRKAVVFTCISPVWQPCFLWLAERVELFITCSAVCLHQNVSLCWLDTFKLHYIWFLDVYSLWEAMIRESVLECKMHQKNIVVLEAQEKCSVSKPGVI